MARAPALHAGGRRFESVTVHLLFRDVAQSGSAPGLGPGGPRFESWYPDNFYYQRVFIVMVLLEGRKEDIYNKYKGQIDTERKLNSSFEPLSIYDILIGEPFIQQTNYKYLEPLIQQHFFFNEVYPRQGKELEELEPNHPNTAVQSIRDKRNFVQNVVPKVEFFDKNKDKYPKKDLREYIGDWFDRDFLSFTDDLIKKSSIKQEEKKAKKQVEKIYDSDTVLIVKPKTHTASCYYGAGTKWCTTMKDNTSYFDNYTKNANLYYIIVKKKKVSDRFYKIALNIKPGQKLIDAEWYDVMDNMLGYSEKDLFLTIIPQKAIDSIYEDLKQLKDSWFTAELVPQIENTGLMQNVIKISLGNNKTVIVSLRFYDFELFDDLGDIGEEGEFQRFNAKYRLSEYNPDRSEVVDPDIDSSFYEEGMVDGVVLAGDTLFQIILNFEQTDEYGNQYISSQNIQIENDFRKEAKFSPSMSYMLTRTLEKVVSSTYFKEKQNEFAGKKGINRKYTMAGYTFTKGGKLTKALINYIDSLPEGTVGNKLDFLKRTGQVTVTPEGSFSKTGRQISLQGYLSSFFSAANQAGIIQKPEGKNGYIKGPNFDKYKEKFY